MMDGVQAAAAAAAGSQYFDEQRLLNNNNNNNTFMMHNHNNNNNVVSPLGGPAAKRTMDDVLKKLSSKMHIRDEHGGAAGLRRDSPSPKIRSEHTVIRLLFESGGQTTITTTKIFSSSLSVRARQQFIIFIYITLFNYYTLAFRCQSKCFLAFNIRFKEIIDKK